MLALPFFAAATLLPLSAIARHQQHHHQQQHDQAAVYLFDAASSASTSSSSSSGSVSPSDANAVVSAFLRIEEYEMLRDGLELPQLVLGASSGPLAESQDEYQQPLMILADKMGSEGSIADYISESTLQARQHHSLQVSNSPESKTWQALLAQYTQRLSDKFGLSFASASADDSNDNVERFLLPGSLNGEYAVDASMQDEAYATYLDSLASLAGLEQSGKPHLRLTGMSEIAHKYGKDSAELIKAKEMMRLSVDSVLSSHPGKVAFFLVPGSHPNRGQHKHLRGSSSTDAFSTYTHRQRQQNHRRSKRQSPSDAVSPLVPTTSQCFASADVCSNSTNACYGHGSCVQGKRVGITAKAGDSKNGGECWVCKCQNAEDDNGRMKYYSGQFCQKEDRSSQFFLLVGSAFFLILVTAASVGLLTAVGSEPLPSTLAALGGGHAGHAKRD